MTICIEGRHAAVVHFAASGEVLAHRSKFGKDFAWGLGPLAFLDGTRAWMTQAMDEAELHELDLAALKATKVKKVEWDGILANVATDDTGKVRVVATMDSRKLYVVDGRKDKPVVREVPWPDFSPPSRSGSAPCRRTAAHERTARPRAREGSTRGTLGVRGTASTVEVPFVSAGGANRGVYVELGGPALMDKLVELVEAEVAGVKKALTPRGASFRADFEDLVIDAAYEEVPKGALPNPPMPSSIAKVTVRGAKAGQGLLTVRIGPVKAEPGRGSVLQGKSVSVT
ncbi:MAG: hypothetical protein U0169_18550 [Polyangiaceae bacterium]